MTKLEHYDRWFLANKDKDKVVIISNYIQYLYKVPIVNQLFCYLNIGSESSTTNVGLSRPRQRLQFQKSQG